jgi:EmrB/QacA subfamily drug resistance transporter
MMHEHVKERTEVINQNEKSDKTAKNPWVGLIAIMLGSLMVGLDGTIVSVANPQIAGALHTSLGQLQWITNAYLLACAASLVLAGKLGDKFGRKATFIFGVTGFALSSLAIGLSGSAVHIITFRVIQGIFGALIMTNSLSLIRVAFPQEKLAKAIGIFSSVNGLSVVIAPVVGGIVVENLGWRWAFFINTPIGAISIIIGILMLTEHKIKSGHRFDIGGVALLAGTLIALTYAIISAPSAGLSNPLVLGLLILSIILLIGFILVEKRANDPIMPLGLFKNRSITIGTIISVIMMFSLFGSLFFVMLCFQQIQGISPLVAGLRILPLGIGLLVSSVASAPIIEKYGPRFPMAGGMLLMGAGLLIATFSRIDSGYTLWAFALAILGIGLGVVIPSATAAIVSTADIEHAGAASGVQQTANQIGSLLGVAILGAVMSSAAASAFRGLLQSGTMPSKAVDALLIQGGSGIGQGIPPALPADAAPELVRAVSAATSSAFMSGMHAAMMAGVAIAVAGAIVSLFVKTKRVDKISDGR